MCGRKVYQIGKHKNQVKKKRKTMKTNKKVILYVKDEFYMIILFITFPFQHNGNLFKI